MEKLKKCAAFSLAAVFLLPLGLGKIPAYATARSAAEALSWCDAQVGKSLDYVWSDGAQCVDFIDYYYQYVQAEWPELVLIRLDALPVRLAENCSAAPQPGDILVYNTMNGMWLCMRMKF